MSAAKGQPDSHIARHLRRQSRVDIPFFAWVHADGQAIPAESCDFSLGGVRLQCQQTLPTETACRLVIELSNRHGSDLSVYCRATVTRTTDKGMALRIDQVEDRQGYDNLRNLLLLHAEDPARALRELQLVQPETKD
jgi:hypothetical protein